MRSVFLLSSIFITVLGTSCNETPAINKPIEKKDTTINTAKVVKVDTAPSIISTPVVYDSTKKYIYLTFDDGPQGGTQLCIDLCKKENIKASFFMVGAHASSPGLRQMVKEIKTSYPQLLLANHSTTHASNRYVYFYQHEQMAAEDFYKAQKTLEVPFKIIRLPGNTSWVRANGVKSNGLTRPVCKLLDSTGYNVIGWDVEWNFNRHTAYPVESPERVMRYIENVLANNETMVKNHVVILTHDRMFRTANYADSLAKFIGLLKANKNYVLETIDHYPGLKKLN